MDLHVLIFKESSLPSNFEPVANQLKFSVNITVKFSSVAFRLAEYRQSGTYHPHIEYILKDVLAFEISFM